MDLAHFRAARKPLVAIILSILKCMFYSRSISSAGVLTPPHNLVYQTLACKGDHGPLAPSVSATELAAVVDLPQSIPRRKNPSAQVQSRCGEQTA